jgi:uncharacterized membrane protein
LPAEVLARTYPGLLDLAIAIAAGAAAGYISPRRSVISALPGVGIAVALVPPLVTVGITAQLGFGSESGNALLLSATNLAAIVFAAAVAVPLTVHTRTSLQEASIRRAVAQSVQEWDTAARIVDLRADIDGAGAVITLVLSSPNEPRPAWQLAEAIRDRVGVGVDMHLQYQRAASFEVSAR